MRIKHIHYTVVKNIPGENAVDENDVIQIISEYLSTQFPKSCKKCGKQYNSLREYLKFTTHVGKPISYDAIKGNWKPKKQKGAISASNCSCGSTLAISSINMELNTMWSLLNWARKETKCRGIHISELLDDLRSKIDDRVLHE